VAHGNDSFTNHTKITHDTIEESYIEKRCTKEVILKLAKDVFIQNHLRKFHDIEKSMLSTQ
jgi:hypothetical protein